MYLSYDCLPAAVAAQVFGRVLEAVLHGAAAQPARLGAAVRGGFRGRLGQEAQDRAVAVLHDQPGVPHLAVAVCGRRGAAAAVARQHRHRGRRRGNAAR